MVAALRWSINREEGPPSLGFDEAEEAKQPSCWGLLLFDSVTAAVHEKGKYEVSVVLMWKHEEGEGEGRGLGLWPVAK